MQLMSRSCLLLQMREQLRRLAAAKRANSSSDALDEGGTVVDVVDVGVTREVFKKEGEASWARSDQGGGAT
jgi:hypothetical protein